MKSNYELVDECDNFPCPISDPASHAALLKGSSPYYTLLDGPNSAKLGFIHPTVARELQVYQGTRPEQALAVFSLDDAEHTVYFKGSTPRERSAAVATLATYWREGSVFDVLAGWRDELYPVYGRGQQRSFDIERAASALFGVVTYGVHMTAYVRNDGRPNSSGGMRIWVPRRAATKQTYPGMLDNTVAGGLASGENVFEALVREACEEASLPAELVRRKARAAGTVSYFHLRDARAGGEEGLCQPEVQYIYDLDLTAEGGDGPVKHEEAEGRGTVVPRPSDDEVEEFYLWDVEQVKAALGRGEFKPNCALVLIDFFVRHGLITQETEGLRFQDLVCKMHRKLEFPTA